MKRDVVRSVSLGHPGCKALCKTGIRSTGIDDRIRGSEWGEGVSPTHLMFVVISGELTLRSGKPVACQGECMVIPAPVAKDLASRRLGCRALYVHFAPDNRFDFIPDEVQVYPAITPLQLEAVIEALLAETVSGSIQSQTIVNRWAEMYLLYLERQLPGKNSAEYSHLRQKLDGIWATVKSRLSHEWEVTELAQMAHMSEGHFHRQVKKLYHLSPIQILRRLRLERAADLLRTTTISLDAIAAQVGYATGFALSNAMQKEMGCRPCALRS